MQNENPWRKHVAATRAEHKDKSFKECLKLASSTYTKGDAGFDKPTKERAHEEPVELPVKRRRTPKIMTV